MRAADLDTIYNNGSGINSIALDSVKVRELAKLGMLWGFLKYYHASVSDGKFNMDAELFRVLPKVFTAKDEAETNKILDQWVDHFGVPDSCKNCREIKKTDSTKLMPDYGYLFDSGNFPRQMIEKLEFIKHNRSTNNKQHYYVRLVERVGNPEFVNETWYDKKPYPDAGLRLLALYRFWNSVQYFCPNRHLIGSDWNSKLAELIPQFCNASNELEYEITCLQMIGAIHDSHAQLGQGSIAIAKMKGDYSVPFRAKFIEDNLVVTGYYEDSFITLVKSKLFVGDVIEKIDEISVDSLVKKYLTLVPGSNFPTQLRDLAGSNGFLLRGTNAKVKLIVRRGEEAIEVVVARTLDYKLHDEGICDQISPKIIAGNIGYIYPASLGSLDLDTVKVKFQALKGVIIDLRCYPRVFMPYSYGAWLKKKLTPFAKCVIPSVDIPGIFEVHDTLVNGSDGGIHYNGKVVIIVNEQTQSQAEFTAMALSSFPEAKVIGSTTAGADGNISVIVLPGGILTCFSGIGVLYPDGTESQRVGVKVDYIVKPTIKGILNKRDELVDFAVKLINSN